MTVSAAKAGLLAALLLAGTAAAQPIQLLPRPITPAAPAAEAAPAEAEKKSVDPGPVAVQALKPPDPSNVGTLDESSGGLAADLWTGSDRLVIERLLAMLPAPSWGASTRALQRRLLLSASRAPDGQPVAPSLIGLRVDRLAAMGLAADAQALARLAPATLLDANLARGATDADWLSGDTRSGCERTDAWVRQDQDPYWLKASLYCRVAAGDSAAANLALTLLHEQNIDDAGYLTLAAVLLNQPGAKVDTLKQPTPLQLAMLRSSRKLPPADSIAGSAPGVLSGIAQGGLGEIDLRLAAAEIAESAGTLPAAQLARLYASVPFTNEERQNPAATLAKLADSPLRATALQVQVATAQSVPVARAEALKRLWAQAAGRGLHATLARTTLPLTQSLTPSEEFSFAAADIVRALLAAGDMKSAQAWWTYLRGKPAEIDKAAADAAVAVWPLMLLADSSAGSPFDPLAWRRWNETQSDVTDTVRATRGAAVLLFAEALGYTVSPAAFADTIMAPAEGEAPPAIVRRALPLAAEAGRKGEAVLLALVSAGAAGPAKADLYTLAAAAAALRKAGLEVDARAIAVEAALARGL